MQDAGEDAENFHRWEDDGGATGDSQPRSVGGHASHLHTAASDGQGQASLPFGRLDWVTAPFARFFRIHAIAAAVLLLAALIAMAFSNSSWAHRYQSLWDTHAGIVIGAETIGRSLRGWIADGLMTLFLFVVALELKRELAQGELRNPRFAVTFPR